MSRRGRSSKRLRSAADAISLADLMEVAVISPGAELEITLSKEYSDSGNDAGPSFIAEVGKEGWLSHDFETYPDVATFLAEMEKKRKQEMKRRGQSSSAFRNVGGRQSADESGVPPGWPCATVDGESLMNHLANFRCIRTLSPSRKQRRLAEQEKAKEKKCSTALKSSSCVQNERQETRDQGIELSESENASAEEEYEDMDEEREEQEEETGGVSEEREGLTEEGEAENSGSLELQAYAMESDQEMLERSPGHAQDSEDPLAAQESLAVLSGEDSGSSACVTFPPQSMVSTLSSKKSVSTMEALAKRRRAVRHQKPVDEYMLLSMDESDESGGDAEIAQFSSHRGLGCTDSSDDGESEASPLTLRKASLREESDDEAPTFEGSIASAPRTEELLSMRTGSLQREASELGSEQRRKMHRKSLRAQKEEESEAAKDRTAAKEPSKTSVETKRTIEKQRLRKTKAMKQKMQGKQRQLDAFFSSSQEEFCAKAAQESTSPALIASLTDEGDDLAMPTLASPTIEDDSLPALPSLEEEEEEQEQRLPPTQPAPAPPAQAVSWRTAGAQKSPQSSLQHKKRTRVTAEKHKAKPKSKAEVTPRSSSARANDSLVIVSSDVLPQLRTKLVHLVDKLGGRYSPAFTPDITHLVVGCGAEDVPSTTIKLHQAILAGAKVLSFDWVLDSFAKLKWSDERRFLVRSLAGIVLSQDAHQRGEKPLFHGMQFHLFGEHSAPSKEELTSVITIGGGKVRAGLPTCPTTTKEELEFVDRVLVLCHADMTEEEAKQVFFQCGAQPLAVKYVLDCACHYKLLDKAPYRFVPEDEGTGDIGLSLAY